MTLSVSDALNQRISTRAFLNKPVSAAEVRRLLELASRAPSGGNLQPWTVNVVAGAARQRVIDAVKASQAENFKGEPELEYRVYPKPLEEPWHSRRFACGEAMYAAIGIALRGCFAVTSKNSRIVRIKNTLEMTTVWASEPMVGDIEANPDQKFLSEPFDLEFDADGALTGQVM